MITRALIVFIIFAAGAASSYFIFVPDINDQLSQLKAEVAQREKDTKVQFDKKEKEYATLAKQTKDWYLSMLDRIKHERVSMVPRIPTSDCSGAQIGDTKGTDGTVQESGLDYAVDKSIEERIMICKEDALKLTGLQSILLRAGVEIK